MSVYYQLEDVHYYNKLEDILETNKSNTMKFSNLEQNEAVTEYNEVVTIHFNYGATSAIP
jgi:hypothetical protein